MSTDVPYLLWVDLETTGTNERVDEIIEFAAILTDSTLVELNRFGPYTRCPGDPRAIGRMMKVPAVREMHQANGLLDEILSKEGPALHKFDDAIMNWLVPLAKSKRVLLAGSGVAHFDRRFINAQLPRLASILAYPVVDVGVIRRAYKLWIEEENRPPTTTDRKTHRAMDDIEAHLEEARLIRNHWRTHAPVAE